MTVSTTSARVSYVGNASTTSFAVPFYFLANGDLAVYLTASGTTTRQTLTTHYTVIGAGGEEGGSVMFVTAPAAGTEVTIIREPAQTQEADYSANDPFPAETHETALDRLTMIAQHLQDQVNRAVLSDVSNSQTTITADDIVDAATAALAAAEAAEAIAAGLQASLYVGSLAALAALPASSVVAGGIVGLRDSLGGQFVVLAGTAAANGYTADGVVVVENNDGDMTFVRAQWIARREVDLRWFDPMPEGFDNDVALEDFLAALTALATEAVPATGIIPPGMVYSSSNQLEIGSYVHLDGGGTLAADAGLAITASLLTNANPPDDGERLDAGIEIRNITFDGSARPYPVWLTHVPPHVNALDPVTDPEADYSEPGVVDEGQYGAESDITDIVAAGRRNPDAATTHGYLLRLRGVEYPVVENCTFLDHGSFSTVFGGCLGAISSGNRWERCGRIDTISPALLAGNEGQHRYIVGRTAANPVVITTLGEFPGMVHGLTIELRSEATAGIGLADGTYTALNPSGATFELGDSGGTPINGTGLSTYQPNGRAFVGSENSVLEEDTVIEKCVFRDLNRIAIQVSGNRQIVRDCTIDGCKEGGIFSPISVDLRVHDCTIDRVEISDIVANGFEGAGTNLRFFDNSVSRVSANGIRVHGMFGGRIDDNWVFRSKHEGNINYPYGPFSERYSFGIGTAPTAGTALEAQKYIPIDARSEDLYPVAGSISRNQVVDSRSTSAIPNTAIYLGEVGTETGQVRNLHVVDNDLKGYAPTGDPEDLIEYTADAVDVDTVVMRDNLPAPDFLSVSQLSVVTLTTGRAVTRGESGRLFNNLAATSLVTINLPAPDEGLRYGFYIADTDGIRVAPAGGGAIRIGGDVGSTHVQSTTVGSILWIFGNGSNWFAENWQGTWAAT